MSIYTSVLNIFPMQDFLLWHDSQGDTMAFVIPLPLFPQLCCDSWTEGLLWNYTHGLKVPDAFFPKSFLGGGKTEDKKSKPDSKLVIIFLQQEK